MLLAPVPGVTNEKASSNARDHLGSPVAQTENTAWSLASGPWTRIISGRDLAVTRAESLNDRLHGIIEG